MEENKYFNRLKVVLADKKRTNKRLAEQLGKIPSVTGKVHSSLVFEYRDVHILKIISASEDAYTHNRWINKSAGTGHKYMPT